VINQLKIFISHAYDEKALAEAWKKLIETTSMGLIEVWFSSDTGATGGVEPGIPWLDQLYQRLTKSDLILAIQTRSSAGRSWIMWECGLASGIGRERGIIPIVYSMARGELANPLTSYQAYQGDDEDQVHELCRRLIQKTGLTLPDIIYNDPIKTYLASVNLYNRSRILREEQIKLWRDRIDSFVQAGRAAELNQIRQQMYTSLNSVGKPISISIHDMLSELLLQQKNYSAAIEEIDYAITFAPDDVHLLHRKALAYLGLGKRNEAKQLVDEIILRNNNLKINSDIASLQGRIHRELWEIYHSPTDLEDALNAYYRAYLADKTSYYTGINAAELAFTKGDEALGIEITKEVLATCQAFQSQPIVSFWVDFSTGAAYLGLAEIDKAIAEYEKGLNRNPKPRPRERESALKGASRMAEAKKLSSGAVDRIQALLQ
jgi:tetratricopeptide (TPR) repeat protein